MTTKIDYGKLPILTLIATISPSMSSVVVKLKMSLDQRQVRSIKLQENSTAWKQKNIRELSRSYTRTTPNKNRCSDWFAVT